MLSPQNEVADLKEMYRIVKREKAELEKKLVHIRGVRILFFSFSHHPQHISSVTSEELELAALVIVTLPRYLVYIVITTEVDT